jgi:hypothetical protein
MKKKLPTIEAIRAASYNPLTGLFAQKTYLWKKGEKGGYLYLLFRIGPDDWRRVYAHRVAWASMTGAWPKRQVDHINSDRADNRWENLRAANPSENGGNQGIRKNNTSGAKGVSWYKRDSVWTAHIKFNFKKIHLGRFRRLEDAAEAYRAAAVKYFGEFARVD